LQDGRAFISDGSSDEADLASLTREVNTDRRDADSDASAPAPRRRARPARARGVAPPGQDPPARALSSARQRVAVAAAAAAGDSDGGYSGLDSDLGLSGLRIDSDSDMGEAAGGGGLDWTAEELAILNGADPDAAGGAAGEPLSPRSQLLRLLGPVPDSSADDDSGPPAGPGASPARQWRAGGWTRLEARMRLGEVDAEPWAGGAMLMAVGGYTGPRWGVTVLPYVERFNTAAAAAAGDDGGGNDGEGEGSEAEEGGGGPGAAWRRWRCAPALSVPRSAAAAAALGGRVYAIGGQALDPPERRSRRPAGLSPADLYLDQCSVESLAVHPGPARGEGWRAEPALSCARVGLAAAAMGGR
jgi:hypothetical protein